MVVSKEQQAEDKMLNELAAMVKKLTSGMETLNGVQTMAVATMIKEIAQRNGISVSTRRHSADIKKETDLGHKALAVKEKLKASDEYLVRLRHKLNIEQEREHGNQVRRNINLRANMDSFNDKFTMLKKSFTGGFGFQAAMNKTVINMGRLTRNFEENKIASEKLKIATKDEADAKMRAGMAYISGDEADQKLATDEWMIKNRQLEGAKDTAEAAGKKAAPTQGMFKPMFEKLGKLGEFLGKKAVPIGIGVGVAGIFMSIIVKAFSASPLFAAMMKMMKFMVTLILMPIGTFFGALLRPILILLLRKLIIPMFSTWMPIMMKAGDQLGKWLTSWSWDGFVEAVKSINPLYNPEESTGEVLENDPVTGEKQPENKADPITNEKDFLPPPGSTPYEHEVDIIAKEEAEQSKQWWDENIWDPLESLGNLIKIRVLAFADDSELELMKLRLEEQRVQKAFDEELASMKDENEEISDMTISEAERAAGMYPVDQEEKDRAAARAELEAEAKAEREKPQNDMNRLMNEIIETGTSMVDTMPGYAARGTQTVNPNTGRLSSEAYSNAGISQEALDRANAPKGHVTSDNYSQKTKDLLASMNSGVIPAANGFDGMVNSPTMFLAGESGSEHVSITPSGSGGSGGITVNIQNMNGSDNDLRKLKKTILEVIQESSANRGRI